MNTIINESIATGTQREIYQPTSEENKQALENGFTVTSEQAKELQQVMFRFFNHLLNIETIMENDYNTVEELKQAIAESRTGEEEYLKKPLDTITLYNLFSQFGLDIE